MWGEIGAILPIFWCVNNFLSLKIAILTHYLFKLSDRQYQFFSCILLFYSISSQTNATSSMKVNSQKFRNFWPNAIMILCFSFTFFLCTYIYLLSLMGSLIYKEWNKSSKRCLILSIIEIRFDLFLLSSKFI